MLVVVWEKNFCFLCNEEWDIWDLFNFFILDFKIRRSIIFRDKEELEFSEIVIFFRVFCYDYIDVVL